MMKNYKLDTIYIGGGTPTTLEPYQLKRLLEQLGESFGVDGLVEFTIEAGRPDSITTVSYTHLDVYKRQRKISAF